MDSKLISSHIITDTLAGYHFGLALKEFEKEYLTALRDASCLDKSDEDLKGMVDELELLRKQIKTEMGRCDSLQAELSEARKEKGKKQEGASPVMFAALQKELEAAVDKNLKMQAEIGKLKAGSGVSSWVEHAADNAQALSDITALYEQAKERIAVLEKDLKRAQGEVKEMAKVTAQQIKRILELEGTGHYVTPEENILPSETEIIDREQPGCAPPQKRKRRTKAEMAAAQEDIMDVLKATTPPEPLPEPGFTAPEAERQSLREAAEHTVQTTISNVLPRSFSAVSCHKCGQVMTQDSTDPKRFTCTCGFTYRKLRR